MFWSRFLIFTVEMKRLFIFLLVAGIVGQASIRTLWVVHYQLDKAAYIKVCENKNKPNLHCEGKCYLKKQMGVEASDNTKEPKLPYNFREIKDIQLFCESLTVPVICFIAEAQTLQLPPYLCSIPATPAVEVFHPPSV